MSEKLLITSPNWPATYARRAASMQSSPIRALMTFLNKPEIISLAGGLPAPETFPKYEMVMAILRVITDPGQLYTAWQYAPTQGYDKLRQFLAEKVGKYGVPATASNILLTNGSQQALDLIGKVWVDEKTVILTERPTYLGALQAWNSYEGKFITAPMDANGLITDELPVIIEKYHPKFIYVVPNFHNPGGVCMSLERREKLVEIAQKYNLFIVEDDPYGDIRFEGEHITPIVSLAKERTFYLCTFSKTLAPGARTGWVIAPEEAIKKLVQAKEGADLFSSWVLQMMVYEICASGMLPDHVKRSRDLYRERRDAMLSALEKYAPEGVSWTHPEGGLFLWLTVPEKINVPEFFKIAVDQKVAFIPGVAFYPVEVSSSEQHKDSRRTMRLNFSLCPPEKIEEGIKRLMSAVKQELAA